MDCREKEKNALEWPPGWNPSQRAPQHGESTNFSGRCYLCSEFKQQAANCSKQNDKTNVVGNTTDSDQEHVLVADILKKYNKLEDNTWLCDSGDT